MGYFRVGGIELRHRLFVYGTLLQGERRHNMMARARLIGETRTAARFTLHDLGRCPAMTAGGATAVCGLLYEADGPTMIAIDAYECHPRFFRRQTIELEDGSMAVAYLVAPGRVRGFPAIAAGDWRLRFRPRPRIRATILV